MQAIKKQSGKNRGYLFNGVSNLVANDVPLADYPRTQWKRDSYCCLNGLWDLKITKEDKLPDNFDRKVMVPFPLEALDSLVNYLPEPDDIIFYHTVITLEDDFVKDYILLRFDGIDQDATIYIDRKEVYHHIGMVDGFTIKLDKTMPKKFDLIVKVKDQTDENYHSRGKQALKPVYWSYTSTTGIYKPVWMESVSRNYLVDAAFNPDFENNGVRVKVNCSEGGTITLRWKDKTYTLESGVEKTLHFGDLRYWSIDDPYLYQIELDNGEDCIKTYFAIRKVEIIENNGFKRLYLNDKPLFISGLLDQGYYGYNNLTPKSYDEYKKDILLAKEMGFNCLRVHIKVECDAFYTLCDQLGMYLIQDYPCGGNKYKLLNVAIPRVLSSFNKEEKITYKKLGREDREGRDEFVKEANYIVEKLHNHPSILIHTIFNEGWGEFDPSKVYQELKNKEHNVLFDTASGWYEANESDFFSVHTYSIPKMKRKNRFNRCFIISEAGGVSLKYGDTPYKKMTGHGKAKNKDKLMKKIEKLYRKKLIPQIEEYGLCGIVYTQFADVETEYNGLYDLTRNHCKIDIEKMKQINDELYQKYEGIVDDKIRYKNKN